MNNRPSIALVGAGAMGGALLRGWLAGASIDCERSAIFDPKPPPDVKKLCDEYNLSLNPPFRDAFDFLFFAVKPQMAKDVLPLYNSISQRPVVVSVMAGQSASAIAGRLNSAQKVVRAMPNLPAAIGKGVTGVYATAAVSHRDRAVIETLMAAVGEVVWIDQEDDIDLVTAISGSGPAYFFLVAEALAEAGEALGLSKDEAVRLAHATFVGAGDLLSGENRTAAEMRKAVTSPGGTTAAALAVLDGDDKALRRLIKSATKAAAKRASELTD